MSSPALVVAFTCSYTSLTFAKICVGFHDFHHHCPGNSRQEAQALQARHPLHPEEDRQHHGKDRDGGLQDRKIGRADEGEGLDGPQDVTRGEEAHQEEARDVFLGEAPAVVCVWVGVSEWVYDVKES